MSQLLNEVSNESEVREVSCGEVCEMKRGGGESASEVNEGRWNELSE